MRSEERGGAIIMRQYGGPEVLCLETVSLSPLGPNEIRIRSIASAVNHSDLEIRAGNWPILSPSPFPYTPGLEVVGDVIEVGPNVSGFRPGDHVITMMQGLGGIRPQRPGGYAEYVVVSEDAAAVFPANVNPLDMAVLGLASITAFEALKKIGDLKERRIAVTGASGGVGSAGVTIARAQGAVVVGIISRSEQAEYVRSLGASTVLTSQEVAAGALAAETLDGIVDTVAGKSFKAYVEALRPGGTLSCVGAVGGNQVSFDAYSLLQVTLTGYASDVLDGTALRNAINRLSEWIGEGVIQIPARSIFPLKEAAMAHAKLEQRLITGRVLLTPK
jgi:NADPH:quinone reductase